MNKLIWSRGAVRLGGRELPSSCSSLTSPNCASGVIVMCIILFSAQPLVP